MVERTIHTTTGVEVWRAGAGLVPFVGYSVWGHGCGTVWRPVPKEPCVVVTNDVRLVRLSREDSVQYAHLADVTCSAQGQETTEQTTKTGRGATKADSGQGVGQAVELAER